MAGRLFWARWRIVLTIALFAILGQCLSVSAADLAKGLAWLQAQVQSNGTLANENSSVATHLQARSEAAATLGQLATTSVSLVSSISAVTTDNTEYLARQAIVLAQNGQNATSILASMLDMQNFDGGFGGNTGFASTPLDTAWALLALVQNGQVASTQAAAARGYLTSAIQADSGMDGISLVDRIQSSALALLALQASQSDLTIATIVKNLGAWLLKQQGADGSWLGDVYLSAETYGILLPQVSDPAVRISATAFLSGAQGADGSWGGDPFLTAIALRALSTQSITPAVSPGMLSGVAVDATSGLAIPDASATLSGSVSGSQTSAPNGSFSFASLPAGSYSLQVSSPGYTAYSGNYMLATGQALNLGAILLMPSSSTGIVRGTIVDGKTGQALPGVAVAVSGSATLSTQTDANGQFVLAGVPAGSLSLSANLAGYASVTSSGSVTAGQTLYFSPAMFATGSTGIPTTGRIAGQVVALGSGTPLPGVIVTANGTAVAVTGSDGKFGVSLTPSAYALKFSLSGYSTSSLSVALVVGTNFVANVALSQGLATTSIAGVVTDQASSNPIAGAQVQIIGGTIATTAADGSYSFTGLSGLTFNLRAGATGYVSQSVQLQESQPGNLVQNFTLATQTGANLNIGSLTPTPASAGSRTDVGIAAIISNNSSSAASVVPVLHIMNAQGVIVSKAVAYDASGAHMLGITQLGAGQQLSVLFRWNTGQFPAGDYTLDARLLEPGSVTTTNPDGQLLVERQGTLSIVADPHFSGSVTANPPVVHANSITPVQISAVLQNDGNAAISARTYQLKIINATTNTVVETQTASGVSFISGGLQSLTFTAWTPPAAADYKLLVTAVQTPSEGSISTTVHVGDAATAKFTVDQSTVPVGTRKVRGTIHVTGQDALTGTLSDPLVPLIKTAIQKGVTYSDAAASSFTLNNRCNGCHVQSQALVGGNLTQHITTYDAGQRATIFNKLTQIQKSDGRLDGYGGFEQTQTMLGLWALTSVENKAEIISILVKAADYSIGIQGSDGGWTGDRTSWPTDGWWWLAPSHTPFNVKNLIEVSKALGDLSGTSVSDSYVTGERAKLDTSIQKGVNWLLIDSNYNYNVNMTLAQRLIGLGSALGYYGGQPLAPSIQAKMSELDALLRSRQNSDGGWGVRIGQASDSLVTAQVGVALDMLNPPASDPAIRTAVQLLLSRQQADGSWKSENGIFYGSNLGPTTWVVIWLPYALNRIGGIDTSLSVTTPANVALSNPSLAPASSQANADGGTTSTWTLPSVQSVGIDIGFDLTLANLVSGEQRPIATDAHLTFNNTFTQQPLNEPITIPVVTASSYLTLGVATDAAQYGPNQAVAVTTIVANGATGPNNGSVNLAVYASDRTLVKDLGTQTFSGLASGAQQALTATWNTGSYAVGSYSVVGTLFDTQGGKADSATVAFTIGAGLSSSAASADVKVDKASYLPTDTVNLSERITNPSQNQTLSNLTVTATITGPGGSVFWTQSVAIAQLVPGGIKELNHGINLALAQAGSYSVAMTVSDATGTAVASAATGFTVQSSAATGSGLKGSVTVSPASAYIGDTIAVTASAANQGNADMSGVPLTLAIVDPTSQAVIKSWNYTADIAQGKSYAMALNWTATGSANTTYVAVLTANIGGKSLTLGSANFTIISPPVKLGVTRQAPRQGRLLVLVSCRNGEDAHVGGSSSSIRQSGPGDDDKRCTSARATFLDGVLANASVPHLITTTETAFLTAFRGGQYNVYWISGGADKLTDTLAKEIREAVNRGDGILLDGIHDNRNHIVDETVGLQYQGLLHAVNEPLTVILPPLAGTTLKSVGRANKFKLGNGTLVAKFTAHPPCDDCDDPHDRTGTSTADNPAIASYVYGRGKGVVMAFDLIGTLQTHAADPNWTSLIQLAFDFVTPEAPSQYTGGAYAAARTRIVNQGPAVNLIALDTLPPGAKALAGTPAPIIDGGGATASWNTPLAAAQSADLTLYLRLPPANGSYTLDTAISSVANGQTRPYADYPLVFQVASALDAGATGNLIAALNALVPTGRDRSARDQAVKSMQDTQTHASQKRHDLAIATLLDAIDKLRAISAIDISAQRLQADRWLQELELQWQLAQPAQSGR